MRRVLVAAVAALWSCQGTSDFQVSNTHEDGIPTGETYLPLLSGHRLATHGGIAVLSDPEGDRADGRAPGVWIVTLATATSTKVALPDGSRPGAVELSGSTAWVVLEGSRGVVAIDTATAAVSKYYATCPAPADIAVSGNDAWVACTSGEVAKISGGEVKIVNVPGRPTAIAAGGGKVFVALADAVVVTVELDGVHRMTQPTATGFRKMAVNTPRRLIAKSDGSLAMLHQASVEGEVLGPQMGGPGVPPGGMNGEGGGAYSGGGLCPIPAATGVVSTADANGTFRGGAITPTTLAIDEAVGPSGETSVADPASGQIVTSQPGSPLPNVPCGDRTNLMPGTPMPGVFAVAYDESGKLIAASAGKNLIVTEVATGRSVALRGRSVPVGFDLFHASPKQDSAAVLTPNVSCATCHPGGLNNGATLTVNGVTHKVMTIGGHLESMGNVHWDNHTFQAAVIEGTWETNMGGRPLTASEAQSLAAFIGQLKLPTRPSADSVRLAAGEAAFDKAGCGSCHVAATHYTNNAQADVGRGMHRVPSLVGLAYSAPYMADGCAKTLEQRFDIAACGGGAQHGNAAMLTVTERDALIVFLKSL